MGDEEVDPVMTLGRGPEKSLFWEGGGGVGGGKSEKEEMGGSE